MTNFILVHGGYHGAWCWDSLTKELSLLGHKTFAIDLPGHGNDKSPREKVTLSSYGAKVRDFIEGQNLDSFKVVGHSAGTIIFPFLEDAFGKKIEEFIYIAGLALDKGERAIDQIPKERHSFFFEVAEASPDYSIALTFDQSKKLFFNGLSDSEIQIAFEKLTPQPLNAYLSRAYRSATEIRIQSRYIVCDKDQTLSPSLCLEHAKKIGAQLVRIDACHDVMLQKPKELARIITEVAI